MNPSTRAPYDLFVDTSGFYALANLDDPYHTDASAVLERAAESLVLFTTNFVLAEAHALFLARRGRHTALDFLRRLEAGRIVIERVSAADEAEALAIIEQFDDKDCSFTDATSFAVMRRAGTTTALTSDRNFVQFGYQQARP